MVTAYNYYLIYLLGQLTDVKSEKYPTSRFWKNEEYGVVFELEKSGILWVHYKIWNNFSNFFSLEYSETQQIMKNVLEDHLNLRGITTTMQIGRELQRLEDHLNLRGITTGVMGGPTLSLLEDHLNLRGITTDDCVYKLNGNWKTI